MCNVRLNELGIRKAGVINTGFILILIKKAFILIQGSINLFRGFLYRDKFRTSPSIRQIERDTGIPNSTVSRYLLYMEKDIKTGIVSTARCTKQVMYEKLRPVQQTKAGELYGNGLTMYPIVPMIWLELPNDARGVSEVEQLIPNQPPLITNAAWLLQKDLIKNKGK